jgi:hypothetical protein
MDFSEIIVGFLNKNLDGKKELSCFEKNGNL